MVLSSLTNYETWSYILRTKSLIFNGISCTIIHMTHNRLWTLAFKVIKPILICYLTQDIHFNSLKSLWLKSYLYAVVHKIHDFRKHIILYDINNYKSPRILKQPQRKSNELRPSAKIVDLLIFVFVLGQFMYRINRQIKN